MSVSFSGDMSLVEISCRIPPAACPTRSPHGKAGGGAIGAVLLEDCDAAGERGAVGAVAGVLIPGLGAGSACVRA